MTESTTTDEAQDARGFRKTREGYVVSDKMAKTVTVEVPRKYLSIWDEAKDSWTLLPGNYTIMVGGSSDKLPLTTSVSLK